MNHDEQQRYWRGPAERAGEPTLPPARISFADFNRRQFLEAAGFSLSIAALSGCGRAPVETAHPLLQQPEGLVPGRSVQYASTCGGCSAGCGLLVKVRDGRPLKMEGMPEHPLSHGGLCAIGQALPLSLYDSQRLTEPLDHGKQSTWALIDERIKTELTQHGRRGIVVVVTSTVTSPTLQATIDTFLGDFEDGQHVVFDSISSSSILDAHSQTHGARILPHYCFDRAKVIISLGADFLGTWISPVEFTAGWRQGRVPSPDHPEMSYHVQLEGRMSLTGSNADKRLRVAPHEFAGVLSHLALELGTRAGLTLPVGSPPTSPLAATVQTELAERLWQARGECLVVCDSQDIADQVLVNYINHALGNYGRTLDIETPSLQRQGNDADVLRLVEQLTSGDVAVLIVAGTDLTHNLPSRVTLTQAIKRTPLVISCNERIDDIGALAHFVCPSHHSLESWTDAEPVRDTVCLSQPVIRPLGNTRSFTESLSRWMGRSASEYEIIQSHWREQIHSRSHAQPTFQQFWDQAVHDGVVQVSREKLEVQPFRTAGIALAATPSQHKGLTLTLYAKIALTDSRHAHNPWLQELPDPVTKVTWDNYICVSDQLGNELGLTTGDLGRLTTPSGAKLELPVYIQPGQHDRVLAVALGYGVRGTDRFAHIGPQWLESRPTVANGELVGKNAAVLRQFVDGVLQQSVENVQLERVGKRRDLATTQEHHSLEVPKHVAPHGAEVRNIVQETSLRAYANQPTAGSVEMHHDVEHQLWAEDHPKTGHHWGMVIDLNCCTGCSACLVACQSENNVPVVGKDEVRRQREMHWIRIDRYYSGESPDISVSHQPMMCHHCDNAPCETVCPVLATVHGAEGLNEQAYNRCVGTRYCANNCPYKVRRFNWFKYDHLDSMQNLALNPDVTVRSRGVMEKCSMCVQRIEQGKLEAKRLGMPVEDGLIQTACQQSCPAQAIVFGDRNDPQSRIAQAEKDPRRYGVLEEFNFRPSVSYLRVIRNREDGDIAGEDGGAHHA
jgi:molybdopterin-containing oxidoreductase family iron-sulfur binding subunit